MVRTTVDVMRLIGLARLRKEKIQVSARTIDRWCAAGRFPAPVKLGIGRQAARFWDEDEVDAFIAKRLAERKE